MMQTNPQLELARRIIAETGSNLFLTGKAGTGKTTFLRQLRAHSPKRMVWWLLRVSRPSMRVV